ncbi:3-oxoacyl-[acyl-carrier protein] reductase [Pseudanabaena sp. lw0831]|uniref:SDR family oxidoreductase n=1 Tax=Pseudanabaena sp. lw0831 TaxID=1357935 RepID=UPI001916A7AC|nr:SDR family oxidoreductase [Pseudanabaena sp. lw0831]GBO52285.1 3-oxoacyl-[acyl-carrier protein] reductase [Pseudanabaena sp. lw0831]
MSRFEQIQIGDRAEISHKVVQDDIDRFVELTGDDNKLHTDKAYAAKTTFKKPVVHGMLGASFISTIIGTRLPGDGALWFSQSLEFLMPVRVGDDLTITAEVIKKYDKLQTIEIQTDIYNQDKQKVTTGVAKVKIIEEIVPTQEQEVSTSNKNKVALVVGATGGIGKAASLMLAKEGFDVLIHYFSDHAGALELKQQLQQLNVKAETCKADVTKEEDVKELIKFFKRKFDVLTVVVNCATLKLPNIKIENLDWEDIQKQIDINIKSNFFLLNLCFPIMEKAKYGKIVFLETQYTESTPPPELLPYITAKAALYGFGKSLAVELASRGIRVNFVSPSMTETELIANIPEKVRLVTAAKTPLRRLANPEDIAHAIAFLASDKSDFMTGETLRVNGGQVMI